MKKNKLPLPILMILIIAFSGMGLFCFYVILQVVKSIPPDFTMPWYVNLVPILFLVVAIIMLLWVKKHEENPDIIEGGE